MQAAGLAGDVTLPMCGLRRQLQELNLGWCECVTEIGLQAVAECCPDLEMLDLCGCTKVSSWEIIVSLKASCTKYEAMAMPKRPYEKLPASKQASKAFHLYTTRAIDAQHFAASSLSGS